MGPAFGGSLRAYGSDGPSVSAKGASHAALRCQHNRSEMPQRAAKAQLVVSKLREWRIAFEANALQADEQEVDEDFLDTDERPVEGTVDGGGLVDTVGEAAEVDAWVNDIADEREKKRFRLNDWVRTAAHAADEC